VAQGHGQTQVLRPEEQLAETLVSRFELTPPIDLRTLAKRFAEVQDAAIPGACEGLALGLTHKRPQIIVHPTSNARRARFTLAHELGHVLIPWHTGINLACLANASDVEGIGLGGSSQEVEANRFAGEILVPGSWLQQHIASIGVSEMKPLVEMTEAADVSAHVACLRLAKVLPPGFCFALLDTGDRVELTGQSAGMTLPLPTRGEPLSAFSQLDGLCTTRERFNYGWRPMVWWSFHEAPVAPLGDPARTSKDELRDVVQRHVGADEEAERRIYGSISSVIGAANSMAGHVGHTSAEQLHARFRSRFTVSRNVPRALLDDPDFRRWLERRAVELAR
jgi:Zn-dependent peptidase ImmA (M78 family)